MLTFVGLPRSLRPAYGLAKTWHPSWWLSSQVNFPNKSIFHHLFGIFAAQNAKAESLWKAGFLRWLLRCKRGHPVSNLKDLAWYWDLIKWNAIVQTVVPNPKDICLILPWLNNHEIPWVRLAQILNRHMLVYRFWNSSWVHQLKIHDYRLYTFLRHGWIHEFLWSFAPAWLVGCTGAWSPMEPLRTNSCLVLNWCISAR